MVTGHDLSKDDPGAARLFRRCIFCGGEFDENALFGRVPPGRGLTYDPARGRLWSVCERCRCWNLIPLEERFDAIETLERAVRDRGRLLASTPHVSLVAVEDITVTRIGPAPLVEQSAWRYGHELRARHATYRHPVTRLRIAALGACALAGEQAGMWKLEGGWGMSAGADILRWRRFGSRAWSGRSPCPSCGSVLRVLRFNVSWWLHPRLDDGRLVIGVPCTRCDPWDTAKVFDVHGKAGFLLLRRVLAYQNVAGARDEELRAATRLIETAGSVDAVLKQLATGRQSLWRLGPMGALALEIAVNAIAERRALELLLRGVEARWREEEALARIVDDELS
jgi:hypothetical protein